MAYSSRLMPTGGWELTIGIKPLGPIGSRYIYSWDCFPPCMQSCYYSSPWRYMAFKAGSSIEAGWRRTDNRRRMTPTERGTAVPAGDAVPNGGYP